VRAGFTGELVDGDNSEADTRSAPCSCQSVSVFIAYTISNWSAFMDEIWHVIYTFSDCFKRNENNASVNNDYVPILFHSPILDDECSHRMPLWSSSAT
jgi:hypothetical protein